MKRIPSLLVCVAMVVYGMTGCDSSGSETGPGSAQTSTRPRTEPRGSPSVADSDGPRKKARRPTPPGPAEVSTLAIGDEDHRRVKRAVADLKKLHFWKPLTKHVVEVNIRTRPGVDRIPRDGHLADALLNAQLGRNKGRVCDIVIYSEALVQDVDRQLGYYYEGRLGASPPSLRQFWAVILAHEMAHCTPRGQKGEAFSTIWERRILAAYETARLGTPGD